MKKPQASNRVMLRGTRGQMEMVGLVFIVAIVVIGMIIYIISLGKHDTGKSSRNTLEAQKSPTFLTAIVSTDLPMCSNIPFSEVVQKCINQDLYCDNLDPCASASAFLGNITEKTLFEQGNKYAIWVGDTQISHSFECNTTDKNTLTYAESRQPITLGDGTSVNLILTICR